MSNEAYIERFSPGPAEMKCLEQIAGEAKTASPNPKDLFGNKKVPLSLLAPVAQIEGSMAMEDGAYKYGPYNWREHPVQARIYIDALKRHVMSWEDGEEFSGDAQVHHLGHVIACASILLDAQMTGNLIDDRKPTGLITKRLEERSKLIEKKQLERKAKKEEAEGIAKFQRNTADLKDAAENSETPLEFLQRLADKAALNVDANVPDVRTIPVQGSPKDSAEVPVRLDMGQLVGRSIMPKDKALAELKKDYERFAADIRTSRFDSSVEEPTRPRRVPNGF
jgi:hypothetical protein